MRFLFVIGSPRQTMCTYRALKECASELEAKGHECAYYYVPDTQDCNNCRACKSSGKCRYYNINFFSQYVTEFDGIFFGSPVYYGGITGNMKAFLTKLFYAHPKCLMFKPIACIVSSRRAGSVAALQEFYLPFLMHSCYIVGSQYWCEVHGDTPEEVELDYEGLQCMRTLALNMEYIADSFLKNKNSVPVHEEKRHLNFISREYKALLKKDKP